MQYRVQNVIDLSQTLIGSWVHRQNSSRWFLCQRSVSIASMQLFSVEVLRRRQTSLRSLRQSGRTVRPPCPERD